MARDCNGKEITIVSKVKPVNGNSKGRAGIVNGIKDDCVFVVFDDDKLPIMGDYNDYNLQVID
jgi:hypothetical protein